MSLTSQPTQALQTALATHAGLAFALLVGSHATGRTHAQSDWDIAVVWKRSMPAQDRLIANEELRQTLRHTLNVPEDKIDLIDLADARLAMRAQVAEDGQMLYLADELAWIRFLQNTWAELEDNDWRSRHAA